MKFEPLAFRSFVRACVGAPDRQRACMSERPSVRTCERAINHSFCGFAASGHVVKIKICERCKRTIEQLNKQNSDQTNERMNEPPNKRTNERTNERTNKRQETNRKSEGKSVIESFKLFDYTMFNMIIQTKICYLFQILFWHLFAFLLNFIFTSNRAIFFLSLLVYKQGYIFFPKKRRKKL